ncbi:MAG TPA: protocatechuate 3,4-dioxygenase subunit alpha [Roseiflexaceae bacterium]|nr:protocatechuate 3,4-dioxygenase subunit alpha [Roseiflexaceae bacterium]
MRAHGRTSSQTVGPFFHPGLLRPDAERPVLAQPGAAGRHIRIEGTVFDGDRLPIPDAMIEIWQANAHGRYNHPADDRDLPLDPSFIGFGRSGTDSEGRYWFTTVKPGRVPFDAQSMQAPHVCVAVFARGLLNHLLTRLYFADDPATADDPLLALVPAERRSTLLAQPASADGASVYRFDIVLQGAGETVFFNF